MAKYLKEFQSVSNYQAYISNNPFLPNVSNVIGEKVHFTPSPSGPNANGHSYVDLGLPSGTLWATMNVGANAPEDYGNHYAWGETETKSEYSWETYEFGSSSEGPFSKYNGTDDKIILDLEDDAARVHWGGDWKMPTEAQLRELSGNTTSEWTTLNGVSGCAFTSIINGNSIFFPAAGKMEGLSNVEPGEMCSLWSSSLKTNGVYGGIYLFMRVGGGGIGGGTRRYGQSVRGVLNVS